MLIQCSKLAGIGSNYRKPAAVGHKLIYVQEFASKGTTFQGHGNKF